MSQIEADETRDTLLKGQIVLFQSRKGYRHSVDSLILADFIKTCPSCSILDIGTGNGIIPLLLSKTRKFNLIVGVEIQKELSERARRNVILNNASHCIQIECSDICEYKSDFEFDMAVSNPPYRKLSSGKLNPNHERAIARHEIKIDLERLFNSAQRLVKDKGLFVLIHKFDRLQDMNKCSSDSLFNLERERQICSREGEKPNLLLREYRKNGTTSLKVEEPLFIYRQDGSYTDEMECIFEGRKQQ